jgi:uncharacterized protein YjbI with pentapeptide repeats
MGISSDQLTDSNGLGGLTEEPTMSETLFRLSGLPIPLQSRFAKARFRDLLNDFSRKGAVPSFVHPFSDLGAVARRDLSGVVLHGAVMRAVYISDFDLSSADLDHADFELAQFKRVDAREASFASARFRWCRWSKSELYGATLKFADFSGCDLTDVNFHGCDLSNARFCAAVLRRSAFSDANLTACDFSKAYISQCDFGGADFDGTNLSFAQMDNCSMPPVRVGDANFFEASWNGSKKHDLPAQPPKLGIHTLSSLKEIERIRRRAKWIRRSPSFVARFLLRQISAKIKAFDNIAVSQ